MAELQGKSKREAEFARRQRERGRDERLDRFEQERQGYVAELESENDARVEAARQRQVKLYTQWDRDVFQKINEQVMRKVDDIEQRSLEKRLRGQSDEFVQQINRNGGYVFLEPTCHRERHRIDAAQRSNVRYSSEGLIDPLKDEQNRLLAERAEEAELERLSRGASVSTSGRWSLEHALGVAGVDPRGMGRLGGALDGPTKVVDWGLDYELGSKVGGGQFGGRKEQLPGWNRGSTALHEMSTDPATAAMQERLRRAQGVRLSYDARAKDGGASVGRWKPGDYSGAAMERLGNEVRVPPPNRPFGRQQQNTDPIMPNHYNGALASAATHRREQIAVNGRGRKLGPYGPTGGGVPPAGGGGGGPPNILL